MRSWLLAECSQRFGVLLFTSQEFKLQALFQVGFLQRLPELRGTQRGLLIDGSDDVANLEFDFCRRAACEDGGNDDAFFELDAIFLGTFGRERFDVQAEVT